MDALEQNARSRRPGQVLAAERERQGLGPADIAQRLHMSVWQVEALEKDHYAKLPKGPFLRGFVRNYAKALGLPPQDILALLAEGAPREPAPRIVVPSQNIRFDPLSERIANPYLKAAGIATVVVVFAFAAIYWWVNVRNTPPPAVAKKSEPVAPAPKPAPAIPSNPPAARPPIVSEVVAPPPAPVVEKPRAPDIQPVAVREPGGSTLKFQFRGKSWVEVRDRSGKVLAQGLNEPGSAIEVNGKTPLKVVVGNAPEVRMFLNERELDLEPHMREAVARLTLE